MKSSTYWRTREAIQKDALYEEAVNAIEKALAKRYFKLSRTIVTEFENLYLKILAKSKDRKVLVSDLYQYEEYYEIITKLNTELNKLGVYQEVLFSNDFVKMYIESKKITGKEWNLATSLNEEQAKIAIKAVWCQDGLNFSDRIWKDKTELFETLRQGLVDCVSAGKSNDYLTKQLINRFNVSYFNGQRIVRTELIHIQNQATYDTYKEAGVEEYQYIATPDARTCEECSKLDRKVFKMSEAQVGVNFPPIHPQCRDTIVAITKN